MDKVSPLVSCELFLTMYLCNKVPLYRMCVCPLVSVFHVLVRISSCWDLTSHAKGTRVTKNTTYNKLKNKITQNSTSKCRHDLSTQSACCDCDLVLASLEWQQLDRCPLHAEVDEVGYKTAILHGSFFLLCWIPTAPQCMDTLAITLLILLKTSNIYFIFFYYNKLH